MVINTHGHPDHAGGNAELAPALMNPVDFPVYETMASREFRVRDISHMPGGDKWQENLQPTGPAPIPVENGAKIDLGGRELTVVYAPGHTKGSLCVYDEATGFLFAGDNVQAHDTALREDNSATIEEFYETLQTLRQLHPTKICGGHKPNIVPPEQLDKLISCAKEILDGAKDEERPVRGGQMAFVHTYEDISISYRNNRYKQKNTLK